MGIEKIAEFGLFYTKRNLEITKSLDGVSQSERVTQAVVVSTNADANEAVRFAGRVRIRHGHSHN
jgi:hypothetical protein